MSPVGIPRNERLLTSTLLTYRSNDSAASVAIPFLEIFTVRRETSATIVTADFLVFALC